METLEALYLPQFPDSCYVFFHAALHFALLITHGGWPLGEYVVGGDGIAGKLFSIQPQEKWLWFERPHSQMVYRVYGI